MAKQYTELEYLAASQAGGKWGFQLDAVSIEGVLNGVSVLTIDLPSFMARVWTLNLMSFRFQRADVGGHGLRSTNQQPPDNQTYNTGIKVRVDYGVDSASEIVRFDYPSRGATVQFHGSSVRVYLESPAAAFIGATPIAPPLLGGYITPMGRGAVAQDKLPCCTYTELLYAQSIGETKFWWAPARARGYRIIPTNATTTTLVFTTRQRDFDQAVISLDMDNGWFDPYVAANGSALMTLRDLFMPLLPTAQGVSVETNSAGPSAFYFIQWLLDIG